MILFILTAAALSLCYQLVSILAALAHTLRTPVPEGLCPPVSILKPVRGLDDDFYAAIRGHAMQDYPEYEIVFGVREMSDPAVPAIRKLIAEFPEVSIRLIEAPTDTPNLKAGVVDQLIRAARYPVLLVNDSDIGVPASYLRRVTAPLADPRVGVVTCLYYAEAHSPAGKWEAFGSATDFIPSTLVALLVGIREFGLGSTLCFRREDLERIGGFLEIAEYLADDYQLAKRITALGKQPYMSELVVSTQLNSPSWHSVWRHQVRWARTIRASRGGGYLGLPITHTGLWALLAWMAGFGGTAALLILVRIAAGLATGIGILGKQSLWYTFLLIPLWDLWAFAVWIFGLTGRRIHWRGKTYTVTPEGRLVP